MCQCMEETFTLCLLERLLMILFCGPLFREMAFSGSRRLLHVCFSVFFFLERIQNVFFWIFFSIQVFFIPFEIQTFTLLVG